LQLLVKQSADSGEIEEENYEIIKNAFDFTDHSAKQIMVPRQNITSIDFEEDINEIINKIMEADIPVFLFMRILLIMLLVFSILKKSSENL
jgi:CBS domain containing-hemolysin-like protein